MVKIYIAQEGGQYQLTLIGHAQDEKVCAGVSSLYVALLETASREGSLATHSEGTDAKRAYIWRTKTMRRHMDMFRTGIEALRREYPEHVQLST